MLGRNSALLGLLLALATAHGQQAAKTKSRLAGCARKACSLVIYGDSFTICDYANCRQVGPVTSTNRWAEQIRIALQHVYGNGGTGIIPANVGYVLALGTFNTLNAEAWSCTGPHDFNTAFLNLAPSDPVLHQSAVLHMGPGAVCTFHDSRNIAWRNLNTYYVGSSDRLSVSIDGNQALPLPSKHGTQPTASIHSVSVSGEASHTAVYRSSGNSYIYGAEGTTGRGISVHNLAISGSNSTSINSAQKLAFTKLIPTRIQLAMLAHYTNDVSGRTTTYTNNLKAAINALSPAPVLLVVPPVTSMYPAGAQRSYTAEALALCKPPAISCVNIQDRWGTTYSNSEHRWDGVHPNDKGNLDEATTIFSQLQ